MLNFSKINVLIIYLLFILIAVFSFLNLQNDNNQLINKKINLGLDLQGGSYLLLEINSDSLVQEKIQSKVINWRTHMFWCWLDNREVYFGLNSLITLRISFGFKKFISSLLIWSTLGFFPKKL